VASCDTTVPRPPVIDEDLCDEARYITMCAMRAASTGTPQVVVSGAKPARSDHSSRSTHGFFGIISAHRMASASTNADILHLFVEWASSDGGKSLETLAQVAVFVVDDLRPPRRGGSSDASSICVSAGAIPALLGVFDKLTSPTMMCQEAAATLALLCRSRGTQFVSVTVDGLQRLFAAMDAHKASETISAWLCSVVGNLAANTDNIRRIVASHGIQRLQAAANAHASSSVVMEAVIGAFGNLGTSPDLKRQLGSVEWAGRMFALMESSLDNAGLQEVVIWCIGNLCGDEVAESNLVLAGCLSRIAAAMGRHVIESPLLQENACVTLGNLASSSKHKLQIVNSGLHTRVFAAMDAHPSCGSLQEAACVALGNLATHPFNQPRLLKAGVLDHLYRTFDAFVGTESAVEAVLSALVNLAASRDNRPAIVESGGYARVMKALELYVSSQSIVMVALCAMKSFVAVSLCRAMMRTSFSSRVLTAAKESHFDSVHIRCMCDEVLSLLVGRSRLDASGLGDSTPLLHPK
jgi:hypothetical protein